MNKPFMGIPNTCYRKPPLSSVQKVIFHLQINSYYQRYSESENPALLPEGKDSKKKEKWVLVLGRQALFSNRCGR